MPSKSHQQNGGISAPPRLDKAIEVMDQAEKHSCITPAKAAFGSVSSLLTVVKEPTANEMDCVELGLSCADACQALDRGLNGRRVDELSPSVLEAIEQLTATVTEIQRKVVQKGKRNLASRLIHAKEDKTAIVGWKRDLVRILQTFNTELLLNNHMILLELRRNAFAGQEGTDCRHQSTRASALHGELPPPPPRACFGRGKLIEEIVEFATKLEPIALIGAGGIGKTNIALSVLHHSHIKERFGDNRRFIRCDQLSATCAHFLARLSQVIGAGVENPEDLTLLRRCLTSKEMLIVLDNAESILDPQGANAREIYAVVDELSQFETICLCITSRITTVPRHCKRPAIPTLSMEAACDIFYRIYNDRGRSSIINNLLQRLDFHALSITLLATAASRNSWHYDRLAEEWETRRAQTLRADFNGGLAATIELSLASPTFRDLSPGARDLLEVIAFFPQGIDENNLDWLFPTIIDAKDILDKFCVLSLTHRSNGFITMLAPIRDYLGPKDPKSSPLLCTTKVNYFSRLKADINPIEPGFREARWIVSEDLNVEHLLDIFTSIDPTSSEVWKACAHFMQHLYWHKPRKTILGPKIENLPDDQPSKPECLFGLGQLFESVGMLTEQKRLLSRVLRSARKREDDNLAARVLAWLSCANRQLGCCEEGIRQAKEASEAFESLGNTVEQADCLNDLGYTLFEDGQLDAAEEVILRAIQLLPEKGQEFLFGRSHRLLGNVYHSKAKKDKAVYHFEKALGIASPYNWRCELFWIHYSMADLFHDESKFDFAHAHVGQAKAYAVEDAYYMGHAMKMHARIWCRQGMFEDATSKALCAKEMYERLGAAEDLESCRSLLREIKLRKNWSPSGAPDPSATSTTAQVTDRESGRPSHS